MSYRNVNNFIVIAADDRDPWVSWEHHLERGSAGGVDCVAPIGTPVYAPADCTTRNIPNNGTGGNTVTMDFGGGWRDQFMHLSRLVDPGPKRQGELVGYSGDSGSPGQPHVHWHRIDPQGRRRNPWDYFASAPAGGDGTTITEEDTMAYPIGRKKDGALYTVAPSFIRHETYAPGVDDQTGDPGESNGFGFTTRVISAEDRIIWCTEDQFFALIDSMAIPREKVKAVAGGKAWSAAGDARTAALAIAKKLGVKL